MTTEIIPGRKSRSKAWIYYSVLSGLSFIAVFTGQIAGLAGTALFGLYAIYLYRGGRFVIWFW